MPISKPLRILLVDDDEEDYFITKDLLADIPDQHHILEWIQNYTQGLEAVLRCEHDVYLVDYRMGAHNGLDLIEKAVCAGCTEPLILLTGQGEREIDMLAMGKGASDYLVKGEITAYLLERAIRYSVEKARTLKQVRESEMRYRSLFENAFDLIQSVDQSGNFMYVNKRWLEVMGYEEKEIAKLHIYDVVREDQRAICGPIFDELRRGASIPNLHIIYITKSGKELVLEGNVTPLKENTNLKATLGIFHDVTERERMEEELRQSEVRYRGVVDSQTELVCRFLPDTTLTFVNEAYCQYFQKQRHELVGNAFLNLIPLEQHESVLSHVQRLLETGQSITYMHQVVDSMGILRWQQWTDQVILDNHGKVVELQSVGRDITELKQAQKDLEAALEKERELGELKSRFISTASHEFRTPLTTIVSTASFLEVAYTRLSEQQISDRLRKILQAADNMTVLLEDVLVFGRSESKNFDFNPEPVEISCFVEHLIEDLQVITPTHRLKVSYDANPGTVMADEKLLRHILTNLITNAVKYSPHADEVFIKVQGDATCYCFQVQDFGIGIPAHDQSRLFEPFHRATNSRDISGTGLGLAITYNAVQRHGGAISFESVLDKGTIFTVTIPKEQTL